MKGLIVLGILSLIARAHGYFFEDGHDHVYKYQSESDMLGLHNVTTIMQFRVQFCSTGHSASRLHVLRLDNVIQYTAKGYYTENPKKWDLKKLFFFQVTPSGVVDLVHIHKEDKDEAVTLKKVLASTFSAKVEIEFEGSSHQYQNHELDHTGWLTHDYQIHRTPSGFLLHKTHKSDEQVTRHHEKAIRYNKDGTLNHVSATDSIFLAGGPNEIYSKPMNGDYVIRDTMSGDFPHIASTSLTQMYLLSKRRKSLEKNLNLHKDFVKENLLVKSKPPPPITIGEAKETINKSLQCVHSFENKHAPNRTECVHQLRQVISRLTNTDLNILGSDTLQHRCNPDQTLCQEEKHLFLDIIARLDNPTTQKLVRVYVFENPEATQDEIERCFVHCIAITKPEIEFIKAVEKFCFGQNDNLHGSEKLHQTQRKACLALGTLLKAMKTQNTTPEYMDSVMKKLESWLNVHNATDSERILRRRKRDVEDFDEQSHHHVTTKMVLIHALGNAGLERSIGHVMSYAEPNVAFPDWRRAAIFSLRHYKCHQSCSALLHSVVNDDNDLVREEAYKYYMKHPMKDNVTRHQQDIILSESYTYPTVMRVRRGIISKILKGLAFRLYLPGKKWQKVIGSDKIGASFGIEIRNGLEGHIKPLSGHFLVDVYNEAFAEGHIGILKLKVYIFRALLCFKGHIEYDMNILKDYGINSLEDLTHIFDKSIDSIMSPLKDSIDGFKEILDLFKEKKGSGIVYDLVKAVKKLPTMMDKILPKLYDFIEKILRINGITWVDEMKELVLRVRSLIEDTLNDVIDFYNRIADPVTITLPYAGRELWESTQKVIDSTSEVFTNPTSSFTTMTSQIVRMTNAIKKLIIAKNDIMEASFFTKGLSPYWMSMTDEIRKIVNETKEMISHIHKHCDHNVSNSEVILVASDIERRKQEKILALELTKSLWEVIEPIDEVRNIVSPFIHTFKSVTTMVKNAKTVFENAKKAIDTGKAQIQKLFGHKFHWKFPTRRRPEVEPCGVGAFPTLSGGAFKTKGVDLLLNENNRVYSPVSGLVSIRKDGEVLIKPDAEYYLTFEIIIANVEPIDEIKKEEFYLHKGKAIGLARKSQCEPNFIHLAVRKRKSVPTDDEAYEYVDPTIYLERLMPRPQWVQECSDFKFTHIGQVFDTSSATGKPFKSAKAFKRAILNQPRKLTPMPDHSAPFRPSDFDGDIAKEITQNWQKTTDKSKKGSKNQKKNDLDNFSIAEIQVLLASTSKPDVANRLQSIIDEYVHFQNNIPAKQVDAYSEPQLQTVLSHYGLPSNGGDRFNLIRQLKSLPAKFCAGMHNAIPQSFGQICIPDRDCSGLNCSVSLNYGKVRTAINVRFWWDKDSQESFVSVGNIKKPVKKDQMVSLHANVNERVHHSSVKVDVSLKSLGKMVFMNAKATVCLRGRFSECGQRMSLVKNLAFYKNPEPISADTFIHDEIEKVKSMTLKELMQRAVDANLDRSILMEIDKNIRGALSKMLAKNIDVEDGNHGRPDEIPDKKPDFCLKGDIPLPPLDLTFFDVKYLFLVGPVGIGLHFGAGGSLGVDIKVKLCFLSLTSSATVTPWLGAKVWGGVTVNIVFAGGGLDLVGYLLETHFPLTGTVGFSKFPLHVKCKMDVVIVPLRLELQAFAELYFIFVSVTVYRGTIWSYKTPAITKNIFHLDNAKRTNHKPQINALAPDGRQRRSTSSGCLIEQISNRNPKNPAYRLEVFAFNEFSEVKTFYAIGTRKGGSDVADWSEMTGYSIFVPALLPGGIPLYWTIKVNNSEGLESLTYCQLPTYDSTIPTGRFEPMYPYTSRSDLLTGMVLAIDDTPLADGHSIAVGYTPGMDGDQFLNWQDLVLTKTKERPGVSTELKYFTASRKGKLTWPSFASGNKANSLECAKACIKTGPRCASFDYEPTSGTCDFNDVIEGPEVRRRISGTYEHFQRLDIGYSSHVTFDKLALQHCTPYYINVAVNNELGYRSLLNTYPIIPDFTPPKPGIIGNATSDEVKADQCRAAVTQRCVNVTNTPNHRKIIDGPGAATVFNGHMDQIDELYTLSDIQLSANWFGFQDKESGIWGYTWAVGRSVCQTDVLPFSEPISSHGAPDRQLTTGTKNDLELPNGRYYVTVQAINNVVLGGAMVTTVCHSTPLTIDTTSPTKTTVKGYQYDEDFDSVSIDYTAEDDLSSIDKVEFGLGDTKHNSAVRPYSTIDDVDEEQKMIIENLGLKAGVLAWIRLRATNKAGLYTAVHGDAPILIDRTGPTAGNVYDGNDAESDSQYQSDSTEICAHWDKFSDPETGISRYEWGVGTYPGGLDAVPLRHIDHDIKASCESVALAHNTTYYSTVIAFNGGSNLRKIHTSSNGVLVDTSNPIPGWVRDGGDLSQDIAFSSDTSTVACTWGNFTDEESGVERFTVTMIVNGRPTKSTHIKNEWMLEDTSVSLKCGDRVVFSVQALNGAGLSAKSRSNGFVIDCTPPKVRSLKNSKTGSRFQAIKDRLDIGCDFSDPESGVSEYRIQIWEESAGHKRRFWPEAAEYHVIRVNMSGSTLVSKSIKDLDLKTGAIYKMHVTAVNYAGLSTSAETDGVIVDITPPVLKKVHIGLDEHQEIDSEGRIVHDDPSSMEISWTSRDPESGVPNSFVAIGTSPPVGGDPRCTSVTNGFVDVGILKSTKLENLNLNITADTGTVYYVTVMTRNGAGLPSKVLVSKPIVVLRANVPGTVYDGPQLLKDEDYTRDKTTISFSFDGFESEACNIIGYEWAVGSKPFFSDKQAFTSHGLVMDNITVGHGQIHKQLTEGQRLHVTVRAMTGPGCREKYILSTSNGIVLDTVQPTLKIKDCTTGNLPCFQDSPYFVRNIGALNFIWSSTDESSPIESNWWFAGSLPGRDDIKPKTETRDLLIEKSSIATNSGKTVFISMGTKDQAGNKNILSSNPISVDKTKPVVENFKCSDSVSKFQTTIKCRWSSIVDSESMLGLSSIAIGTSPERNDILQPIPLIVDRKAWQFNLADKLRNDIKRIYVNLVVNNILSLTTNLSQSVSIDSSPPVVKRFEIVTRSDIRQPVGTKKQLCQNSNSNVEVLLDQIEDKESTIKRIDIYLGSAPYKGDIKVISLDKIQPIINIDRLSLPNGFVLYLTAIIFNSASLSTTLVRSVIVSSNPVLSVFDGPEGESIDYQTDLSTLQAHWTLSGGCPLVEAQWSVENLIGEKIRDFHPVPVNIHQMYSDNFALQNGHTYFFIVKVKDSLNRTFISRSDGVTVMIKRPHIGKVRDGLQKEDINYQYSFTKISANWDAFGNKEDTNPSQIISYYEVAAGTDRKFAKTRHNIHEFVNVGLNRSYTFVGLNLTQHKTVYYITIRAHSFAGSFSEISTDGVRVGFSEIINIGKIEYNSVQSSTSVLEFSWSGFLSDIGIKTYLIGVSDYKVDIYLPDKNVTNNDEKTTNKMINYDQLVARKSVFNTVSLTDVGTNTYISLKDLKLKHNVLYYVTVIAENLFGKCVVETGRPIRIDTTPPSKGEVIISNVYSTSVVFSSENDRLNIAWTDFIDIESGIQSYDVTLKHTTTTCKGSNKQITDSYVVDKTKVHNSTKAKLYDLHLIQSGEYVVCVTAYNLAGLNSTQCSVPIKIDSSPPLSGAVKVGADWSKTKIFTSSTTELTGMFAVAANWTSYECLQQKSIVAKNKFLRDWFSMSKSNGFDPKGVKIDQEQISLTLRHNDDLIGILRSGFQSENTDLIVGNYTIVLQALPGLNMITSYTIAPDINIGPKIFEFPEEKLEQYEEELAIDVMQFAEILNSSFTDNSTESHLNVRNDTSTKLVHEGNKTEYGVGFHIFGYKTGNGSGGWYCLFWVKDKDHQQEKWLSLDFDPTESGNEYNIWLQRENEYIHDVTYSVSFQINGKQQIDVNGLQFLPKSKTFFYVWNYEHYFPPVIDSFHPFNEEAVIENFKIPIKIDKPCSHGSAFFDGESGIQEIWIGVSDQPKSTESNIHPYVLYKRLCKPCTADCLVACDQNCPQTSTGFDLMQFRITNLSLANSALLDFYSTLYDSRDVKQANESAIQTYYLQVKVLNYAGKATVGISKGIVIDTTPPKFKTVTCVDPDYSLDEPSEYLASTTSVGAFWECDEDVSQVTGYFMSVGSRPGSSDIFRGSESSTDLSTKRRLEGLDGRLINGRTYYVMVTAINSAGLMSNMSCNTTVDRSPPNVGSISAKPEGTFKTFTDGKPVNMIKDTKRIVLNWSGGPKNVKFYEWQIGSAPGLADIFPRVKIGTGKSNKVSIIDGRLIMDGAFPNQTISLSSMSKKNRTEPVSPEEIKENSLFDLEPGRCLHYTLYAVSKSHLSTPIPIEPTCITRQTDEIETLKPSETKDVDIKTNTIRRNGEIKVKLKGVNGRLVIGRLNSKDLETGFGSAVSTCYKPFISDPVTTAEKTSRAMRGRIKKFLGTSFYVSPAPTAKMSRSVDVEIKFDPSEISSRNQPALIFWDTENGIWDSVEDFCDVKPDIDTTTSTYRISICFQRTTNTGENKRSVDSADLQPIQYALVKATPYQNTAPYITNNETIYLTEDSVDLIKLDYKDAEKDNVIFKITRQPEHVEVNLGMRSMMTLDPFPNFYGEDKLTVEVIEERTDGRKPLSSSKNFSIIVKNVNDSPIMNFSYPNGTEILVNSKLNIPWYFESNRTKSFYIGNVIITDADANEKFYFKCNFNSSTINFTLTEVPVQLRNSAQFKEARSVTNGSLNLLVIKEESGLFQLNILASNQLDRKSYVTQKLTMNIGFYKNPCVHGHCSSKPDYNISCNSPTRLHTFQYFQCVCDDWYKGQWCDTIQPPVIKHAVLKPRRYGFFWVGLSIGMVLFVASTIGLILLLKYKLRKNKLKPQV